MNKVYVAPEVSLSQEARDYAIKLLVDSYEQEIIDREHWLDGKPNISPTEFVARGCSVWAALGETLLMQQYILSNALADETPGMSDLTIKAGVIVNAHKCIQDQMSRLLEYMVAFGFELTSDQDLRNNVTHHANIYYQETLNELKKHEMQAECVQLELPGIAV